MFKTDDIDIFILLFIPGFISLKVYQLIIPSEKYDFSKNIYEAVGFSILNFGFFYWLILLSKNYDLKNSYEVLYYLLNFMMVFIAPVGWPLIYNKLSKTKYFKQNTINPIKSPWDAFFLEKKPYWVIVYLKNGKCIGGLYSTKSRTSVYPAKEQIYIEEHWLLDEGLCFTNKIENTGGMLILGDEISRIEFIK